MSGDFPTMLASTYGSCSSTTALDNFGLTASGTRHWSNLLPNQSTDDTNPVAQLNMLMAQHLQPLPKQEQVMARRVVQVYIADPNENVPLEDSLIYQGSQKLTDSTDQELFYEIDIKNLLDAYNVKRVKIVDKKVKERTQYLEPVKIRELKMVVVTVASF